MNYITVPPRSTKIVNGIVYGAGEKYPAPVAAPVEAKKPSMIEGIAKKLTQPEEGEK